MHVSVLLWGGVKTEVIKSVGLVATFLGFYFSGKLDECVRTKVTSMKK